MNIGTQEDPKLIKIGARCSEKEKQKFMDILHEFWDVFA
jgi:hypothetical protein